MHDGTEVAIDRAVDGVLAYWEHLRESAARRSVADTALTLWLEQNGADGATVITTIERCGALERYDDALMLAEWFLSDVLDSAHRTADPEHYRTLAGWYPGFCHRIAVLAPAPAGERATVLLRRLIDLAPRDAGIETELSVCAALGILCAIHGAGRTPENNTVRTRAAIAVCDEVIRRCRAGQDPRQRVLLSDAMLQKAISNLEIGEEDTAAEEYAHLLDVFADETPAAGTDLGERLAIARHALRVLGEVTFPEPVFRTAYLEAQQRKQGGDFEAYLDLAARIHHATANLIRRSACSGDPFVLLLRNFDLLESSVVSDRPHLFAAEGEQESYGQIFRFRDGLPLMNRLSEFTPVVHVASTKAGELEIGKQSSSLLGMSPQLHKRLYLPDDTWLDTVRLLVRLAEHIVVWANEKTTGLLQELDAITSLGRTEDTTVLLEKPNPAPVEYAVFRKPGRRRDVLTADDPVLAAFPDVVQAPPSQGQDPEASPVLQRIADRIIAARRLEMPGRVDRVRTRLDVTARG
ncbi:hypothetical protein [Streptomyces boninensis]|uniref:hypothetical protein n=1 Tax=Streptomyces boninensis TaxID=2039455 RepID=UPI003B2256D1